MYRVIFFRSFSPVNLVCEHQQLYSVTQFIVWPSPRRPHYVLQPVCLSVCSMSTVNLKMERHTMFTRRGEVANIRSNWQNNFEARMQILSAGADFLVQVSCSQDLSFHHPSSISVVLRNSKEQSRHYVLVTELTSCCN